MPSAKRPAGSEPASSSAKKVSRTDPPSEGRRDHRNADAKSVDVLRRIVTASPAPLDSSVSSATDAATDLREDSSVSAGSRRRVSRIGSLHNHLALLAHGMALVTLTQRAQQGLIGATVPANVPSSSGTVGDASAAVPLRRASTRVDERWLAAVTRYVNFTTSLDDVAKVAVSFPQWFSVRWTVSTATGYVAEICGAESAAQTGLSPSVSHGKCAAHVSGSPPGTGLRPSSHVATPRDLLARLTLLVPRVPSIEEGVEAAKDAEKSHDGATTWGEYVAHQSAYAALTDQERREGKLSGFQEGTTSAPPPSLSVHESTEPKAQPTNLSRLVPLVEEKDSCTFTEDDEAILSTLSPELRGMLSRKKLRGVLQQMREETGNATAEAYERIEREQETERLLSTYALVRSYFGAKKESVSAGSLLECLESGSLFEDHRRRIGELSMLIQLPGSGLTAVELREVREGQGAEAVLPTQSNLVKLDSLENLSKERLETVLVYLDREKGSVKAILAALKAQPSPP